MTLCFFRLGLSPMAQLVQRFRPNCEFRPLRPSREFPGPRSFLPFRPAAVAWSLLILGLVWASLPALAQEPPLRTDGWIQADAPEARLSIRGPVSISGTAPLPTADLPSGEYELRAEGPGLPAVRGRFVLSPKGLSRRAWAGPSALLLPPGFVHLQRGDGRGWPMITAAIGGGAMTLISHDDLQNAGSRVDRAELAYSRAVSEEAIDEARQELLSAAQEQDDQKEMRSLWIGYLGATWVGASLEAILLTPQPSIRSTTPDGNYLASLPRAGGMGAAFRSFLVPGGGQRFMGRTSRANFFFTATAALAAAAIASHESFLDARRDQMDAQYRFDHAEDEADLQARKSALERAADRTDEKDTVRWILVGAASGVYLWNVIDAFGLGRDASVPGLSWSVAPGSDGVLMSASWSFP